MLHSQQLPRGQNIPCQQKSGVRDLFKTKKNLQGCFLIFFLQGRKSKCIFKPIFNYISKNYKKKDNILKMFV